MFILYRWRRNFLYEEALSKPRVSASAFDMVWETTNLRYLVDHISITTVVDCWRRCMYVYFVVTLWAGTVYIAQIGHFWQKLSLWPISRSTKQPAKYCAS